MMKFYNPTTNLVAKAVRIGKIRGGSAVGEFYDPDDICAGNSRRRYGGVHIDALNAAKGPSSADVALSGSAIRNLGITWNPPIRIGKGHNAEVAFNRPYLGAAYNFDIGTGVTAIRYVTSTDGGNTFTRPGRSSATAMTMNRR